MVKVNSKQYLLDSAAKIYTPLTLRNLIKRCMFLLTARKHALAINTLNSRLDSLSIPVTSEMLGTIIWPYIHNEWDVATKLDAIATHYEALIDYPKLSQINIIKQLQICDFSQVSPAITIDIDYAKWFTREGEACHK